MSAKDNKGVLKNTSLQAWSKLTEEHFGKKLRIEERKDREAIYNLLKDFGLPYEKFKAFKSASEIKKDDFLMAIGELGTPYWISATPKLGVTDLNRLSKLGILSAEEGLKFIKTLERPSDYKVIVMQYPDDIQFKGSALVSKELNGIADFVKGDQHLQLIAGLTLSDPMLFNPQKILRYSTIISKDYQENVYSHISSRPGHYEFQYGTTPDKTTGVTFFDYNDEPAYEDIDSFFNDLLIYLNGVEHKSTDEKAIVKGIPACLGKVEGYCKIVLSNDTSAYSKIKEGDILVSDVTTPDMTLIMKKVAAIITDLGGVTSHAAIVCRELKIPCIVGTKNGTEILRDDVKVEVDAFKGVVKLSK